MAVSKVLILVFALIAAALCDQPSERVKKQVVVANAAYPYAAAAYPYAAAAYPYAGAAYPYAAGVYPYGAYPYAYAAYDDGKYYPGKYDVY